MKTVLKLLAIFILLIAPKLGIINDAFGSYDFFSLESQISPESSSEKIIKLQTLFKELGLYVGNIDGIYKSIKGPLIDYQIKSGIIKNKDDWGAGYFGKKTINALNSDYSLKFEEKKEIIKLEEPKLGETYFIVTAYYSPIPNQKKYTTGSYAGDIKLNGSGKNTASGKGVFAGLLAAPKNYNFGTRIELDGIGVGAVEDRGGAILNAGEKGHEYDRIDVWMGYGDEGLDRAKKWGKRTVKGKILDNYQPINVAFGDYIISNYNDLIITPESRKEEIQRLQELFKSLNLYSGEITGAYNDIKDSLVFFQIENDIIKSANEDGAGYFGPKTIVALREKYPGEIFKPYEMKKKKKDGYKLTYKEKKKLKLIKTKLDSYIVKKSKGNNVKKKRYENSIKKKISQVVLKTKDKSKKAKLEYILELM